MQSDVTMTSTASPRFSLFAFGVPLAAVFGIVTFCLNFIPTVGLLIAVLLPFPLVYFSDISTLHKVAPPGFTIQTRLSVFYL